MTLLGIVVLLTGGALAATAIRLLFRDTGQHAAPRGRAAITWAGDQVIPRKPTWRRPPWEPQPPPPCILPAAFTAAQAYVRGLVREAERLATRPWADDTLTWSRQLLLDAMATAETTGWAR